MSLPGGASVLTLRSEDGARCRCHGAYGALSVRGMGRPCIASLRTVQLPQVTLHQGEIEKIFLDAISEHGVQVERAIVPRSIEVSSDEHVLRDPHAYAVKVVLQHLNRPEGQQDEAVYAKYVLGSDGTVASLLRHPSTC